MITIGPDIEQVPELHSPSWQVPPLGPMRLPSMHCSVLWHQTHSLFETHFSQPLSGRQVGEIGGVGLFVGFIVLGREGAEVGRGGEVGPADVGAAVPFDVGVTDPFVVGATVPFVVGAKVLVVGATVPVGVVTGGFEGGALVGATGEAVCGVGVVDGCVVGCAGPESE